jgi:hypothetical protein
MLEIGVWKGGSLDMWRKFFGPDATLFGVDINSDCARFDGKSASVRIGSQDDPEFLRGVVKEMGKVDIVLDDGSHIASHQRASFEALFPLLSEGGLYIAPKASGSFLRPQTQGTFLLPNWTQRKRTTAEPELRFSLSPQDADHSRNYRNRNGCAGPPTG